MDRFTLAAHAYVCVDGEYVVFLDLKADQYWALEASQTMGLGDWVDGWPVTGAVGAEQASPAQTTAVLEVLRGRGLLAEGRSPGKNATPVLATPPTSELLSEMAAVSRGGMLGVLTASIFAKLSLGLQPLHRVVGRCMRRKSLRARGAKPLDVGRARALTESFFRCRVFLFSSRDECLHDSLSLLEFLAAHDIHADWVFGVQARPFAAHCWVQHGSVVFNDTLEHVRGYTPIMIA
jgi:hypothetical protein